MELLGITILHLVLLIAAISIVMMGQQVGQFAFSALLGAFIDTRTFAGLTSAQSTSFAHGLPAAPDFAFHHYIATIATATNHFNLSVLSDATNVTVNNGGSTTSPNFRVVSVVAHSVIR